MKHKSIIRFAMLFLPLMAASCGILPSRGEQTEASNEASFPPEPNPGETAQPEEVRSEKPVEQYPWKERFPTEESAEGVQPAVDISSEGKDLPVDIVEPEITPDKLREQELLALLRAASARAGGARLIEAVALIAEGQPDRAYEMLKESGGGADVLLVEFLTAYLDYKLGNSAESLEGVEALVRKMREEMPLQISTVKLCRKVQSYAKYEPFAQLVFEPGEKALIYCEPAYFRCDKKEKGYLVSLNVHYRVEDSSGKTVWKKEYPVDHVTEKSLYDLFLVEFLAVPDVPDGNYTLKVELQDKQSDYTHTAEESLVFEVRRR
ncbi:MAG: hypothetical protein ABIH04_06670 [Planctomycetota bacterium]